MRLALSTVSAAVLLVGIAPSASAREQRVEVTVVEVAGGRAYLKPGEDKGLQAGVVVEIGNKRFTVVSVTADNAVVELGGTLVAVGARGHATVESVASERVERLPEPSPLSRFAGQWRDPKPPALGAKAERAVPLGRTAGAGAIRAAVVAHVAATVPDGALAASLGGEVHVQPWRQAPLGFDADAAVLLWAGGAEGLGERARPLVRVRELRLRYGGERRPWAALGRLRWAAEGIGLLDGARLTAPLGRALSLSAFGGFVPDPIDGRPTFDASRFGVDATWAPPGNGWRPRVDVTAHGSIWEGALDERRATASLRLFPRRGALAAYAELSGFDADNPWGAAAVELTAAGAEGSWRSDRVRAQLRVDARQPERSRFLASLLPQSWLCTAQPQPPGAATEPCDGARSLRLHAAASAGVTIARIAFDAGGAAIESSQGESWSAFAGVRLPLPWRARGEVGTTATRSPFVSDVAFRVGAGAPVDRIHVDVAAWYRGGWLDYRASTERWYEHRAGLDLIWSGEPDLDVAVSLEGTSGPDIRALAVIATAVWRPSP